MKSGSTGNCREVLLIGKLLIGALAGRDTESMNDFFFQVGAIIVCLILTGMMQWGKNFDDAGDREYLVEEGLEYVNGDRIQCTTAGVATDRRTNSISIVTGEEAECVGTTAGSCGSSCEGSLLSAVGSKVICRGNPEVWES